MSLAICLHWICVKFYQKRDPSDRVLHIFWSSLYFYASALTRRQRVAAPPRLSLYWTSQEQLTEALVEIPYRADDLDQLEPPSQTVCKSCDIRSLCRRERVIG